MSRPLRRSVVVLVALLLVTGSGAALAGPVTSAGTGHFEMNPVAAAGGVDVDPASVPDAEHDHSTHDHEAGDGTPAAEHLGFGAPAGLTSVSDGGEFTFGVPPVPTDGPGEAHGDGAAGHTGHGTQAGEYVLTPPDEDFVVAGLTATVAQAGDACPADAPVRRFRVDAIEVNIVYNAYGQHDPDGRMYVLRENRDTVLRQVRAAPKGSIANPDPDATTPLVEPLTLRAHVGDCVEVDFHNGLSAGLGHASIHPTGVSYGLDGADGMAVGRNEDSTVAPGESTTYRWYASRTGSFAFADGANVVFSDDDDTHKQHGLFGSLIVYDRGTRWIDPETGGSIESGTKAVISPTRGADYREFVVYYHDSAGIVNHDGSEPAFPNGEPQSLYTLNYRGDPTGARLGSNCGGPNCEDPELFYSSWVHGDPGGGDLVFPAYVGDPITYRVIGSQAEETHVHHHHGHRWKSEPGDGDSRTVDAESIHTGATYTQEFVAGFGQFTTRKGLSYEQARRLGGAGYAQGSAGDYIFHCHLFPHYASGMWAILRVNDRTQPDLVKLPDRAAPPTKTAEQPGFPYFVKEGLDWEASFDALPDGEAPPVAPLSRPGRDPTAVELRTIDGAGGTDPIVPGAPYRDPCPSGATVREYDVSVFRTDIVYNEAGDHDPNGIMYALSKDVESIRDGEQRPRPLVIRANVGDCVQVTLNNELDLPETRADMISMHIHFVGYDVLGSDGVNLGFNYLQGANPGETITYRWYADEEGTVFWHDHVAGFERGMHGVFGALVVEPAGSRWLDPRSGQPVESGTHAMIDPASGESFREFVLFLQDFVRLYDRNGRPINPPELHAAEERELNCHGDPVWCDSLEDQGVMGINYANAPLYHRDGADPAYTYSSWVHGDPLTPLLETYANEKVRVRVLQGTFEEAHTFTIHGTRWHQEERDRGSPLISTQSFGVSEQFESHFDTPAVSPGGVRVADYLYGSQPVDDRWNGMWGILRVWGHKVPHLQALPGSGTPPAIPEEKFDDLRRKGLRDDDRPGPGVRQRGNSKPPQAPTPGNPCPSSAPVRAYEVVGFTTDIPYNEFGDHDPYGIVFATREDYEAVRDGERDPEPLVIRANAGECIEVTLHNELPTTMSGHTDHAVVPVNQRWTNSNRLSLHPQLVRYDVQRSDGATVGFNWDQTVGPGETITYRWYADRELGTAVLTDLADVRSHRHHGAFGLLVVEPRGSTWHDPYTGEPITSGAQAVVLDPNGQDFREYALAMTDGMYVVNPDGTCVVPKEDRGAPCNQASGDPEDQGFKGINYRSEPLGVDRRLGEDGREHRVFSSPVHGDPATPLLEAYVGDPVRFRVGQPADKPRGVTFHLAGHVWPHHWTEPRTQFEGAYGLMTGTSTDIVPVGGAGGERGQVGDFYYGGMKLRGYVEGGLWGIFRVHPDGAGDTDLMDVAAIARGERAGDDDDAPPAVTVDAREAGRPDPHATLTVAWTASDDRGLATVVVTVTNDATGASETVAVDTAGRQQASGAETVRFQRGGGATYTVSVTATDDRGNTGTASTTLTAT